jgi:hypothetical protein
MKDLYDILEEIKHQPIEYLGRTSVVALKGFINGYSLARRNMGLPLTEQEQDFQGFQEWINPSDSPFFFRKEDPWDKLLILFAQDENKALAFFFKRLEDFKNRDRSGKSSKSIDVAEKAIAERARKRAEWRESRKKN